MVFEICWKKSDYNGPKLTAESFVNLWQSSSDADDMEKKLINAARPHLIEELTHAVAQHTSEKRFIADIQRGVRASSPGPAQVPGSWHADDILSGAPIRVYSRSYVRLSGFHVGYLSEAEKKEWEATKDHCSARIVVSTETYVRFLTEHLEYTEREMRRVKERVQNPMSSGYFPSWWALLCRARIFRKKGVNLKFMEGLEETKKVPAPKCTDWKRLATVAVAAS